MVALEAQACGTPVIASPVAALNETVKGGILTNDFANAVSQLQNKSRWAKLSKSGKEFAAEHSWPQVAMRWEQNVFGGQK
jgi:glycosyltransferase involved in cell wall biosynthesis